MQFEAMVFRSLYESIERQTWKPPKKRRDKGAIKPKEKKR
jgi:hypothetical protein